MVTAAAWLSLASASAQSLPELGQVGTTAAAQDYCRRAPAECRIRSDEPLFVAFSEEMFDILKTINLKVNLNIRPRTDEEMWGVVDRWDLPRLGGQGDCEDIQLLKRKLLVQAGFPRRALLMTVVVDELGEGHAVLMVRTDAGDFLLDNKHNRIRRWDETGYVFVKRESQHTGAWVSLGNRVASGLSSSVR